MFSCRLSTVLHKRNHIYQGLITTIIKMVPFKVLVFGRIQCLANDIKCWDHVYCYFKRKMLRNRFRLCFIYSYGKVKAEVHFIKEHIFAEKFKSYKTYRSGIHNELKDPIHPAFYLLQAGFGHGGSDLMISELPLTPSVSQEACSIPLSPDPFLILFLIFPFPVFKKL